MRIIYIRLTYSCFLLLFFAAVKVPLVVKGQKKGGAGTSRRPKDISHTKDTSQSYRRLRCVESCSRVWPCQTCFFSYSHRPWSMVYLSSAFRTWSGHRLSSFTVRRWSRSSSSPPSSGRACDHLIEGWESTKPR